MPSARSTSRDLSATPTEVAAPARRQPAGRRVAPQRMPSGARNIISPRSDSDSRQCRSLVRGSKARCRHSAASSALQVAMTSGAAARPPASGACPRACARTAHRRKQRALACQPLLAAAATAPAAAQPRSTSPCGTGHQHRSSQIELPEIHRGRCGEPPATRDLSPKGQARLFSIQFGCISKNPLAEWLGGQLECAACRPSRHLQEALLEVSPFHREIESRSSAAGQVFHGEGILAVTKALLQSGHVTYGRRLPGFRRCAHLLDCHGAGAALPRRAGVHVEAARNGVGRRRRCWPRRWSTRCAAR